MNDELRKGPSGRVAVLNSDQIQNLSSVPGSNVSEALDNAGGGGGTLVNLYNTVWVDKNTSVAPADQTGNIEAPFSTLAAARTALLALGNSDPVTLIVMPGDYSAEGQFVWDSTSGAGILNVLNGSFLDMQFNQSIQNLTMPQVSFTGITIAKGLIFSDIAGDGTLMLTDCQQLTGSTATGSVNCTNCYMIAPATFTSSGSVYRESTTPTDIIAPSESEITFIDSDVSGDITWVGGLGTANIDEVSLKYMRDHSKNFINGVPVFYGNGQRIQFGAAAAALTSGQLMSPFAAATIAAVNEVNSATTKCGKKGYLHKIVVGVNGTGTVSGDNASFTVRINQIDTALVASISDGGDHAVATKAIAVEEDDDIAVVMTSSGSPTFTQALSASVYII